MKRREFIATGVAALSASTARPVRAQPAAAPAPAQGPVKPANRAEATAIIAQARKIVTPNGVQRLEKVRIGGIEQWVSIRGMDRRNPVLLHIHGGPGYVSIPMSWWFSRDWEEYFTVVQWDQRAAGKTYLLTDPAVILPSLTRERFVADAEEMAAWVRRELGKDKIFVQGHSWGTFSDWNWLDVIPRGCMHISAWARSPIYRSPSAAAGTSPCKPPATKATQRRCVNLRALRRTAPPARRFP